MPSLGGVTLPQGRQVCLSIWGPLSMTSACLNVIRVEKKIGCTNSTPLDIFSSEKNTPYNTTFLVLARGRLFTKEKLMKTSLFSGLRSQFWWGMFSGFEGIWFGCWGHRRRGKKWSRRKHGGLFRAILKNGPDNELKIQCYCNATFVVGCNDKQYLKSYFATHKQNCRVMSELSLVPSWRKRSVEAFQDGLSPVLNDEKSGMYWNNIYENFLHSNSSPFATGSSLNISGEVSSFSNSNGEVRA